MCESVKVEAFCLVFFPLIGKVMCLFIDIIILFLLYYVVLFFLQKG
jgi:hypothetical protein